MWLVEIMGDFRVSDAGTVFEQWLNMKSILTENNAIERGLRIIWKRIFFFKFNMGPVDSFEKFIVYHLYGSFVKQSTIIVELVWNSETIFNVRIAGV